MANSILCLSNWSCFLLLHPTLEISRSKWRVTIATSFPWLIRYFQTVSTAIIGSLDTLRCDELYYNGSDHIYFGRLAPSWESLLKMHLAIMQARKQQLELDMEQQTGSKWEKEYVKAVYCHPAYLTSMQSTSWEMLGWKNHKLEWRSPGEISITSDMQMTPHLWQKVKKN